MSRVEVAPLDSLPDGRGVRIEFGEHRVALFRIGSEVYALGDRCSHAEASLAEGEVFEGEVECPRHGATFDLVSGKATSLPASKPVPVYEVVILDDVVYLEVEDE